MSGNARSAWPSAEPAASSVPRQTAADTSDDTFYVPPPLLPTGAPGDIIRSRQARPGPPTAQKLADAWQVMYLSTGATGDRNAVTGTVLVPKGVDLAKAPVVGFGPGTHGPAAHCAPTKMIDGGYFYEQPAVNDMLRAGYVVTVTDYQGYHPQPATRYMVGNVQGAAVIDGVRAAQRLAEAGVSANAKVAFRGYSQGGGAAMWAGEMQPEYAPELNLVGVAAGGVPGGRVPIGAEELQARVEQAFPPLRAPLLSGAARVPARRGSRLGHGAPQQVLGAGVPVNRSARYWTAAGAPVRVSIAPPSYSTLVLAARKFHQR